MTGSHAGRQTSQDPESPMSSTMSAQSTTAPATTPATTPTWQVAAILVARLIFLLLFVMAASFKIMDMSGTASFIAAAGFPFPLFLAWCALIFEAALVLAFATGAYYAEACLLAAAYVLFLAFSFHGPGRWAGSQAEF